MEYAKLRDYHGSTITLTEFKNFYWRRYDKAENKFIKAMSNPMEAGWTKVWDFTTADGKIISLTRDQLGQMLIEGATPASMNSGTVAVLNTPFKVIVKGEGLETRYNIYLADAPQTYPSTAQTYPSATVAPIPAMPEPKQINIDEIPF